MAYARGDTQLTVDLFLEVIRHDPYVIAAWNTLASVYDEDGNEEGARQMRFFAAHVEDEADTWKELAMEFR
jgi:general transcription factor 3C polypeptide 3 (transcription factor C subunit 4)